MKSQNTDLGETIRILRNSKHMTRAKLSEAAGISESHLKKIENGVRKPGLNTYEKIVEVLEAEIIVCNKGNTIKGKCIEKSRSMILSCTDNQAQLLLEILECISRNRLFVS